jgi:heavy metal sensor kinase
MKRLSIRARLTLWYMGILAGSLLALAGVAYFLLVRSLWQDLDAALEGVAKTIVHSAQPSGAAAVPPDAEQLFRQFFGPGFADRFFQFYDPRGERDPRWPRLQSNLHSVSPKALRNAAEGFGTFETLQTSGPYPSRVLTFPIMARGRLVNVLQVGMSLQGLYRAKDGFLWTIAALLPLALVLAGGTGWLLARRALRPVDQMTQAARRIEAERLNERLVGAEVDDELGRLARTLNEMLSRLETSFAQVRRFSADASHEMRTPLTVLRGELEVALRSAREPAEYERTLKSALEEVARLSALVEALLLLSRADAGALKLDVAPVELDQLLEDVARQGEILGRARDVAIRVQHIEPIIAPGDGPRLKELVLNLVDNAVKYTPAGGQVSLALRAVNGSPDHLGAPAPANGRCAEIVVQDTGIGIPAEALPRIFDRFYRLDQARSRDAGGSGLGLCIAKSIAEAHGGRIEVQSAAGAGSTFTLHLPISD